MAVTIGTTFTAEKAGGGDLTVTSVIVAAGETMLVARIFLAAWGVAVGSVTRNGQSFTLRVSTLQVYPEKPVEIWDLENPTVGTYDVVISGITSITALAIINPLTGCDPRYPRKEIRTQVSFTGGPLSFAMATANGDLVLDAVLNGGSFSATANGSQTTQLTNNDMPDGGTDRASASSKAATTASTSMDWTLAGSSWTSFVAIVYSSDGLWAYCGGDTNTSTPDSQGVIALTVYIPPRSLVVGSIAYQLQGVGANKLGVRDTQGRVFTVDTFVQPGQFHANFHYTDHPGGRTTIECRNLSTADGTRLNVAWYNAPPYLAVQSAGQEDSWNTSTDAASAGSLVLRRRSALVVVTLLDFGGGGTWVAGTGFTMRLSGGDHALEEKVLSAEPASVAGTFTAPGTSNGIVAMQSFEAAFHAPQMPGGVP